MNDNSNEVDTLRSELEAAFARISELEGVIEELSSAPVEEKTRDVSAYKVGDYVSIKIPGEVDPEPGRVAEHLPGKSAINVNTAKGAFTVADPDRIRRQSESW